MKAMKRFIITLVGIIVSITGFIACTEDKLMTFEAGDNIFWALPHRVGYPTDSLDITFAYETADVADSVIKLAVRCMGPVSYADREFSLRLASTTTAKEGEHFEKLPGSFMFRASQYSDTVAVRLLRSESLKTGAFYIDMELLPNENFSTNMLNRVKSDGDILSYTVFRIRISDELLQPPGWDTMHFGTFTLKKLLLMQELLGIKANELSEFSSADKRYFGAFVQRYLNEMEANGTPVLEDDGSAMTMSNW